MVNIKYILFICSFVVISSCGDAKNSGLAIKAGAPLLNGLGNHSHLISSDVQGVQRYFDQGLIMSFAFNHAESIRAFRAAQTLDPNCAMCYWG